MYKFGQIHSNSGLLNSDLQNQEAEIAGHWIFRASSLSLIAGQYQA